LVGHGTKRDPLAMRLHHETNLYREHTTCGSDYWRKSKQNTKKPEISQKTLYQGLQTTKAIFKRFNVFHNYEKRLPKIPKKRTTANTPNFEPLTFATQ